MGLFKRWKAKREAKKKLKEQAQTKKQDEVILKEEKVNEVRQAAKKEASVEKETKARYHVSQNKNKSNPNYKRWGVKLSSSTKTIKYHDTQEEAIEHAKELAKNNDTTIVIHKLDGKIRKQKY